MPRSEISGRRGKSHRIQPRERQSEIQQYPIHPRRQPWQHMDSHRQSPLRENRKLHRRPEDGHREVHQLYGRARREDIPHLHRWAYLYRGAKPHDRAIKDQRQKPVTNRTHPLSRATARSDSPEDLPGESCDRRNQQFPHRDGRPGRLHRRQRQLLHERLEGPSPLL